MIKVLNNENGMTFIELIAGMLLLSIITLAVSSVLAPTLKVYEKANELAECNTLLDNLANQMLSDLYESTAEPDIQGNALSITIDSPADVVYSIGGDGVLYRKSSTDETALLTKNYYKDKSVGFTCTPNEGSEKAYTLTMIISSDKNGEMIRRDYAVRPLALNQY